MKFDDKYPAAQPGVSQTPQIVKSFQEYQLRPCVICDEVTRWFHRDLIVFVCSEECFVELAARNY